MLVLQNTMDQEKDSSKLVLHVSSAGVPCLKMPRSVPRVEVKKNVVLGILTRYRDASEATMSSTIRPVSLDDLDTIMEIERKSFLVAWEYSVYLRICMQNGRVLSSDRGMLLMDVFEKGEKIAGFAVWETDTLSKRGHILNLAVIEEERRKGYGRMLTRHVQESLKNAGMTSCYLEVRESNSPARSLYETCGYVISDRLAGYYFDEDAIVYSRDL